MRQCAGDQGKGTTRSPTAHVATKPRTEGEKQHTQTGPNKLRKHDLGTNAPNSSTASGASNHPEGSATKVRPEEQDESDEKTRAPEYSTVSGAFEVPRGRLKRVKFLPNPKECRTEELDSAPKKIVPDRKKTAVHNKYEVL